MKNISQQFLFIAALLATISMFSCTKESGEIFNTTVIGLEENGLTKSINDLVPDSILQEMIVQGMPINKGDNPPVLEGVYFSSPLTLLSSNIPSDVVGQGFVDYTWTLYEQDSNNLTINVDYESNIDVSEGRGSYIVGNSESFTIFVDAVAERTSSDKARIVYVLSGNLIGQDIHDFHLAIFMIDNFGNKYGSFIENGQGRVIVDDDNIAYRL